MSKETMQHLNTNILVGDVAERGRAWHFNAAHQGTESNHYQGSIPVEDVVRRIFSWSPVEQPITATTLTDSGEIVAAETGRKTITRSDSGAFLGVVGDEYQVHDYKTWLLDSWGQILDSDEVHVSNAGLLRGGSRAFVQIARPDFIDAAGVQFRPFLLAATAVDGSMSSTFKAATTVTVCDNTLEMALSEKGNQHKTRHTSKSSLNVLSIREALGILHNQEAAFAAEVERLVAEKVDTDRFLRWADAFAGMTDEKQSKQGRGLTMAQNKRAQLLTLWRDDARVAPWAGTAFGVLQTANTWTHHIQSVKTTTNRVERNIDNVITGEGAKSDRQALALLATV
jgi:phage/plasmid-like protein (TIGR03299 family)